MDTFFRSEKMKLVQLVIQTEVAHSCVQELGLLEIIQFRDLNQSVSLLQRNFVNYVRLADDLSKKLNHFEKTLNNYKIPFSKEYSSLETDTEIELSHFQTLSLIDIQTELLSTEKELSELDRNFEILSRNQIECKNLIQILQNYSDLVFLKNEPEDYITNDTLNLRDEEEESSHLNFKLGKVCGIISTSILQSFERVLWRTTRGNLYFHKKDLEIPSINTERKSIFIIYYHKSSFQGKVKKICDSFGAQTYKCPDNANKRRKLLIDTQQHYDEQQIIINKTEDERQKILFELGTKFSQFRAKVLTEKSIFHTLNMFSYDVRHKSLVAEGWVAEKNIEVLLSALRRAEEHSSAVVPTIVNFIEDEKEKPPTSFELNKFTLAFHNILESYGVARYRELNPAVFSIVTFPFLFGVMFGDVGHGILLFLFSLSLIYYEDILNKRKLNELVEMCFSGRYLLLAMGLFSIYCGFLYNEVFSIPLTIGGSGWTIMNEPNDPNTTFYYFQNPYPFGVDPAWKGNTRELLFYNSLKMKTSIIFGVIHMSLGIFVSILNGRFFKKSYDVYHQALPQFIFLSCTFGYLVFLILYKWTKNWCTQNTENGSLECVQDPPLLISVMINMFMPPFSVSEEERLYSDQERTQNLLLLVSFLTVPWMLLVKPLILRSEYKFKLSLFHQPTLLPTSSTTLLSSSIETVDATNMSPSISIESVEEFDFQEEMVHQGIHTIEFVLGAISNTTSYLRLWALSLAHAQLSTVFWERIMLFGIQSQSIFLVFCCFSIWACISVVVLLIMESLSAFLHALRLHWVEFMGKFYFGDGIKFQPLSFREILQDEENI